MVSETGTGSSFLVPVAKLPLLKMNTADENSPKQTVVLLLQLKNFQKDFE